MIQFTEKSIIYVLIPANYETGGIELAHQLVDYLRNKNRQAFIVYLEQDHIIGAEVPPAYRKYKIETSVEIEDNDKNLIIIPEIYSKLIKRFKNIQIGFWWMSVDNYYLRDSTYRDLLKYRIFYSKDYRAAKSQIVHFHKFQDAGSVSIKQFKNYSERIIHLYQSTYAKYELLKNGISHILPLSDYINTEFSTPGDETISRKDIILYNPAKGMEFTQLIIEMLPEYRFVPLCGLSRAELNIRFQESKLYIDFGHHPGKDRMPREAAMNGCCIITSMSGAACFFEDIPIPRAYKFQRSRKSLPLIRKKIEEIMSQYENRITDFAFYRHMISKEKDKFYSEIDTLIGI